MRGGVDVHLVFEDIHITELALLGHGPDDPMLVSLVVLAGEYRHPAVSTVIFLLVTRLPLSCLVTGEVSQPGESRAELKEEISQCHWWSVSPHLHWLDSNSSSDPAGPCSELRQGSVGSCFP